MRNNQEQLHKLVIIGGGAGGLELATRLGKILGKRNKLDITLIDATSTHLWKPLLHEVAAGTLNSNEDELNYLAHGHWNNFKFRLGSVYKIDREKQLVFTRATLDRDGNEYIPERNFFYDTLIIAVGSVSNDFGIEGIKQHCHFLDQRGQADQFHQHLLRKCYTAQTQDSDVREGQLHIAIAGAGATGVELAAELYHSTRQLVEFGLDRINPDRDIKITIIEAADRILPGLPERMSNQVTDKLKSIGIDILINERITKATTEGFYTQDGKFIQAEIKVWAAGIKAPDFLAAIDGLETNRIGQLVVKKSLQTTNDENIFAFGDCAACPMAEGDSFVPPRAQAAHQQASLLYKSINNLLDNKQLPEYTYVDYGSLINMSKYSTVGSLMGNIAKLWSHSIFVEGIFARIVYLSLYKMHQLALHGFIRVGLTSIANLLTRKSNPRMKLH